MNKLNSMIAQMTAVVMDNESYIAESHKTASEYLIETASLEMDGEELEKYADAANERYGYIFNPESFNLKGFLVFYSTKGKAPWMVDGKEMSGNDGDETMYVSPDQDEVEDGADWQEWVLRPSEGTDTLDCYEFVGTI